MTPRRLRVVVVGAGAMGGEWIRMLAESELAEPVGVVDLDVGLARRTSGSAGLDHAVVGTDLEQVVRASGAEAVVDVTVPQAHRVVNEQALRLGLPVLCEKPLGPTVAEALRQVAVADLTGSLLMVSQSRRYNGRLSALRDVVRRVGALAAVHAEFFHEDHEPGFREQMAHPLLVDMSIHHFDMLRFLTADEPVAVRCSTWNPAWSWFAGDAAAAAEFELRSGARFVYSGSRCTPGLQTSFNAEWRLYGERGAASWDGDDEVSADGVAAAAPVAPGPESIAGSLAEFVACVRDGRTPQNEVRLNVRSLAMVEAAVLSSARHGERVVIDDLLEQALAQAVVDEQRPDVLERLRSWPTAAAALASTPWGSASDPQPSEGAAA